MSNLFTKWAALRTKILTGPQKPTESQTSCCKILVKSKKRLHTLRRPVFSENISEKQDLYVLRRPVFSETISAEQKKDSKK